MKSITIRLPAELVKDLEQESSSRRVSKSVVARERLSRRAGGDAKSSELMAILEECWAAKVPEGPRRFASPKKQKLAENIRAKKLHR